MMWAEDSGERARRLETGRRPTAHGERQPEDSTAWPTVTLDTVRDHARSVLGAGLDQSLVVADSIRAGIIGRKRHEASASTIRMAGRRRSARDVQALAGIQSRQPGDCRAVLPLRTPQLVEILEVEPELA